MLQESLDWADDCCCCGCRLHYKEYLVSEINRNHIDPVDSFLLEELSIVYGRQHSNIPKQKEGESQLDYCGRLQKVAHPSTTR